MKKTMLFVVLALVLASASVCLINAQSNGKPDIIFVEQFVADGSNIESEKKANRVDSIDPDQLAMLQKVIWRKLQRENVCPDIRLITPGEKPVVEDGKIAWVLGGRLIDYKKGNQMVRVMVGLGAGKQKFEVMVTVKDFRTGTLIKEERVVDRKVAGWVGGDEEKGMRDFAERIVALLQGIIK